MITTQQLNPKLYPQECWINVYMIEDKQELGWRYSKDAANEKAAYVLRTFGTKCLYRIHVRLK